MESHNCPLNVIQMYKNLLEVSTVRKEKLQFYF